MSERGNKKDQPILTGWDYADLKSRVNLQQYGARLNVNLLGFSKVQIRAFDA